MSHDFDDIYQRRPASWAARVDPAPPADGEQVMGSTEYKPYRYTPTVDLETCEIAWWLKGQIPQGQVLQYRFLVRLGYLGDDQLDLMMTDCIIHIQGRNLRDLWKRLARRRVTLIQAYHPNIWPLRPPADEPIIESVTILYPGELPAPQSQQ